MKIFFHDKFHEVYDGDPAAQRGRMKTMEQAVKGRWEIVEPRPAQENDISRCHSRTHIEAEREDPTIFNMAMLAAGGTIRAALCAAGGERAFALIRPPGHHASPGSAWGFCHFNNVAVALLHLAHKKLIESAVILDFDLHFGDGTNNIFQKEDGFTYLHPEGYDRTEYMAHLKDELDSAPAADIIAVSAGFDRGFEDWGNMLLEEDYEEIGRIAAAYAGAHCSGRVFGELEGGYNHRVLGRHLAAFLSGLE